jgi:hypothetical protein
MSDDVQPRKLKKPRDFGDLYPGRFVRATDLKGAKPTVTIDDIDIEELQGDDGAKKVKCILTFRETEKKMVACKTVGLCLKAMFGTKLDAWKGRRIVLFEDVWNGEPALRVFGSPDIREDMEIEIALPRRRPFKKILKRTTVGNGKSASAGRAQQGSAPQQGDLSAAGDLASVAAALSAPGPSDAGGDDPWNDGREP